MNWILRLLADSDSLSPQAASGALMITSALFVWAVTSLWLAFSGNYFAYYGEMSAGAFSIMTAGAGLLGYHLRKTKGGDKDVQGIGS